MNTIELNKDNPYELSEEEIYRIAYGVGIIPYINSLLKDRYYKGKEEGWNECYRKHTESELGNDI